MRAETIAEALGGRKAGGSWVARCPDHDDREPSLSIHDVDDGVRLAFDQIKGKPSRRRCRRMLGRQAAQDWIAGDMPISSSRGG